MGTNFKEAEKTADDVPAMNRMQSAARVTRREPPRAVEAPNDLCVQRLKGRARI